MSQKVHDCEDPWQILGRLEWSLALQAKHHSAVSTSSKVRRIFFSGAGLVTHAFFLNILGVKVQTVNFLD